MNEKSLSAAVMLCILVISLVSACSSKSSTTLPDANNNIKEVKIEQPAAESQGKSTVGTPAKDNEDAYGEDIDINPYDSDAGNGEDDDINPYDSDAGDGEDADINPYDSDAGNGEDDDINPYDSDAGY